MIERYAKKEITEIWSDKNKTDFWLKTESAVNQAMVSLGQMSKETYDEIYRILYTIPIDLDWWKKREKEIRHDLEAFLDERRRFLPDNLRVYFHKEITSYDTEEPAFARMLIDSLTIVKEYGIGIISVLSSMAEKYRYTIMDGRTHGQEAGLQSFGKRCLTWHQALDLGILSLEKAEENLRYSKLSGIIGNYGAMDPAIEEEALRILRFEPFYGATQIMPRELYAPIAQALCQIVLTLNKIATDIRLGARSGLPICQEPFSKTQKGSSAMPHKKNTISCEKIKGMARMAKGYCSMIEDNIETWEERAIEQSCVERVAWPDLFHVVVHSLEVMTRVLEGLVVYPDNMLLEIIEARGCWASNAAKEFLKEVGIPLGLSTDEAYRIVQLAAFNAFESEIKIEKYPESLAGADELLAALSCLSKSYPDSIQEIIARVSLETSLRLEATSDDILRWKKILKQIFEKPENRDKWNQIFLPSYHLKNEARLYKEILGI